MTFHSSVGQAGLLLDLEQYKDKLPSIFEDEEIYGPMLKFQKEKYGTIPGLTMNNGSNNYINNQTFMRYDLYEKVGEPEMADWGEAYGVHNV